jgi:hypothetical protein
MLSQVSGSPANLFGLELTSFITHVNRTPTINLKSLITEIMDIPDNTYMAACIPLVLESQGQLPTDFQVGVVTLNCIPHVISMKKNERNFPTLELSKDSNEVCGWKAVT